MSEEIPLLSKDQIAALQARAAKGDFPSPTELRSYIATTRASYLAAEARSKSKSRNKPPPPEEKQIDFFEDDEWLEIVEKNKAQFEKIVKIE